MYAQEKEMNSWIDPTAVAKVVQARKIASQEESRTVGAVT